MKKRNILFILIVGVMLITVIVVNINEKKDIVNAYEKGWSHWFSNYGTNNEGIEYLEHFKYGRNYDKKFKTKKDAFVTGYKDGYCFVNGNEPSGYDVRLEAAYNWYYSNDNKTEEEHLKDAINKHVKNCKYTEKYKKAVSELDKEMELLVDDALDKFYNECSKSKYSNWTKNEMKKGMISYAELLSEEISSLSYNMNESGISESAFQLNNKEDELINQISNTCGFDVAGYYQKVINKNNKKHQQTFDKKCEQFIEEFNY